MSAYLQIKVRGYHLDNYGHLNNTGYIRFLEEARWRLFEDFNAIEFFFEMDYALSLVNLNINYRHPCFLNDLLEIHTKVLSVGNTSCKMEQTIYLANSHKVIADATVTFALTDKNTNKAVPIEGKAREKLIQLTGAS